MSSRGGEGLDAPADARLRADLRRCLGAKHEALVEDLVAAVDWSVRYWRQAPRSDPYGDAVRLLEATEAAADAIARVVEANPAYGQASVLRAACGGEEALRASHASLVRVALGARRQARLWKPRPGRPTDMRAAILSAEIASHLCDHHIIPTTAPGGVFASVLRACLEAAGIPAGVDLYRSRLRPALRIQKALDDANE